jgi:hypothetical protein
VSHAVPSMQRQGQVPGSEHRPEGPWIVQILRTAHAAHVAVPANREE